MYNEFENDNELNNVYEGEPEGCTGNCCSCHLHDQEMDEEEMLEFDGKITLVDEEGNEVNFDVIDAVLLNDNEYIVVAPSENVEDDEKEIEVVILKVEIEGDDESYVTVTDEEEFEAVFEQFKAQNEENLDIED